MRMYTESDITKFYTRIAMAGPDECWEWLGRRSPNGYGHFKFDGKNMQAHRFAFWISTGHNPDELLTCHSCDNPGCCNPAHLWLGTAKDNMQDALAKGRMARQKGELNGSAKLTEKKVLEIRACHAAGGIIQRQLAADYGVSGSLISKIVKKQRWQHI